MPDVRRVTLAVSGVAGVAVSVRLWAGPPTPARWVLGPVALYAVVVAVVTVPWRAVALSVLAAAVALSGSGPVTRTAAASVAPVVAKRHVPGTTRVLLLGDSLAASLVSGLRDGRGVEVVDGTSPGCAVVTCPATTWLDAVRDADPDVVAVLAGDITPDALDALLAVVAGRRVVLLTLPYDTRPATRVDGANAVLRGAATTHAGVTLVDLGAALDPEGTYTTSINGIVVRRGDAVTADGAKLLRPWLFRQLRVSRG